MAQPDIFARMEEQFAAAPFAVLLTDRELNILYANSYAQELSRTLEFSDGIRLMVPQEDVDACLSSLQKGEGCRLFPSPLRAASVCLSVTPLKEGEETVGGFVTLSPSDEPPSTPREAVEGVSSAALSGSFRYPLSQIFASLSVILRRLHAMDNHAVDQPLQTINQSAYQMLRSVNDMVIRMRCAAPGQEQTGVADLWERTAELLEAADIALRPAGYTLIYSLPQGAAPVRCRFDDVAVALLHLISNACRAGGPGSTVTVTGRHQGNRVMIGVSDSGRGVASGDAERIFQPFFSLAGAGGDPPALGLGLTVAKQIIHEAGGTLAVDSREGEGTSVVFTLPLAQDVPDERLPLECGSAAYLTDRFSPVYWVLSDVISPPGQ